MNLHPQNEAKKRAARMRAEWILSLHEGYISTTDLITAACVDGNQPLLRLALRQILINQPGWGEVRTNRTLSALRGLLGLNATDTRRLTIAWLVDARTGGRRVQAWADCLDSKSNSPWPGFPYAPAPTGGING